MRIPQLLSNPLFYRSDSQAELFDRTGRLFAELGIVTQG